MTRCFRLLLLLLLSASSALATDYYVWYTNRSQTITVAHTWNAPPSGQAPFAIGSASSLVEVAGLHAATATTLAATPVQCSANQCPAGVAANGDATGCTTYTTPTGKMNWDFWANNTLSTSATNYFAMHPASASAVDSCQGAYYNPSVAGTAANLRCHIVGTASPGAGKSYALTLRELGVGNTALTCTISGTGQTCSDTVNTATINAGSCYAIQSVPSGTPTAAPVVCSLSYQG